MNKLEKVLIYGGIIGGLVISGYGLFSKKHESLTRLGMSMVAVSGIWGYAKLWKKSLTNDDKYQFR